MLCQLNSTYFKMTLGQEILSGIKLIGGLAGLVALGWKIFEELKSYLRIKVEVKTEGDNYSVLTEIENANKISSKKIDNAFILISPEKGNLIKAGKSVAERLNINEAIESTDEFKFLVSNESIYIDNRIIFIPLEFYYDENIDIADEKLTYRCFIDKTKLNKGQYSVRFYIYGEKRYHRSTQDLLVIS